MIILNDRDELDLNISGIFANYKHGAFNTAWPRKQLEKSFTTVKGAPMMDLGADHQEQYLLILITNHRLNAFSGEKRTGFTVPNNN